MTKYTAEDFARAEFARHVDGGIAARTATHGDYSWEDRHGLCTDTDMAADPGWSIVRDAESLTAREHLDAAWEKAHETDVIPAGAAYITKWADGGFSTDHTGAAYDRHTKPGHAEDRLLDPPAPTWHNARIIEATFTWEAQTVSSKWARMEDGDWVALDGEAAGIQKAPEDLHDVTVIVGEDR